MSREFQPGDFLVFQLEAGFALLRLLAIDEADGKKVWHVSAYNDFFPDVESAEAAAADPGSLKVSSEHMALTNRAFESTQVAQIAHAALNSREQEPLLAWYGETERRVYDRSVRLMLGIR